MYQIFKRPTHALKCMCVTQFTFIHPSSFIDLFKNLIYLINAGNVWSTQRVLIHCG